MNWVAAEALSLLKGSELPRVTLFAAAVFVFQLGSRGDRFVVAAVWFALVLLPVERYIHHFTALMRRTVLLRYALLSAIALV